MQPLVAGELTVEPRQEAPTAPLQFFWRGRSSERHPGHVLAPYFATAVGAARTAGVPIELHFETLDHLNASTITALIQIVQAARARLTRTVIVYDPARKWQKLSFEALRVLEKDDDLLELRPVAE